MDKTENRPSRRDRADQSEQTPGDVIAPGADKTNAETGADNGPDPATETLEQAPAEASAEQDPVAVAVDGWFAGFNNSALSRNREFWNLVRERLPELKAAIGASAPPAQS